MKKILLYIVQTLISTCLILVLLEGVFFILGFPQGAGDFIERAILQQKLALRKPSGQYRVFVYGESSVHGAGYAPVSSPVKWLDAYLKDFLPGRDIKVVNFGRMGEESNFIRQSFQDTLQYKPDLTIFYLGHNTFYPDNRVDFVTKRESEFTNRIRKWFHKSRLISAIVRATIRHKINRHAQKTDDVMGSTEIETVPAPNGEGYRSFTIPGSPVFLDNVRFFRENIEKISNFAQEKHIPVLFMKPVCNLKDYPPDFSAHLKPLPENELSRWDQLYRFGQEALKKKDDLSAIDFFEQAHKIDPTYADLSFLLGTLYFRKGDIDKARSFFEQARDQDIVIRRAPRDILDVFEKLSQQQKIHYFDTGKALIPEVPGGILGWPIIEDNVHFSIAGQSLVGHALAYEIARNNWIAPRSEWLFDRERSRTEIEDELGITRQTVFLNYCAVVGYLEHRYDERLEFARRAWELFPDDPIALRQLAWAYWLLKEKDKALDIYKHLGEKNPRALEAVFHARPEIQQAYEASAFGKMAATQK